MLVNEECLEYYDNGKINFLNEDERFLASEISYYKHKYNTITIADFYTYLNDKEDLKKVLDRTTDLDLANDINTKDIESYIHTLKEYQVNQEISKLKKKIKEEPDISKQAEYLQKIAELKNNF